MRTSTIVLPGATPDVGPPDASGRTLSDTSPPPRAAELSLKRPANRHARLQTGALLALAFGTAGTTAAVGAIVLLQSDDVGITHTQAVRIACGLGVLAGAVITLSGSLALLLRSRQEKMQVFTGRVGLAPGASLEHQAVSTELSIKQFQELALDQARISFSQSQRAMLTALLLLIAGATAVVLVGDIRGQFLLGAFTVLGSGFSAFLSKTFLDVFRQSIAQLNHSHSIPITKNLVILANTLACSPNIPEGREAVVRDVVVALLGAVKSLQVETGDQSKPGQEAVKAAVALAIDRTGAFSDGS